MGNAESTKNIIEPFANLSVEYYQLMGEGNAYGYRSGMHHCIILGLDNGRKCLVEKVNPHFQRNPMATHADVVTEHDQDEIRKRLEKADFINDRQVPRVREAETIISHALEEHNGHYSLFGNNCQDFARELMKMMDGQNAGMMASLQNFVRRDSRRTEARRADPVGGALLSFIVTPIVDSTKGEQGSITIRNAAHSRAKFYSYDEKDKLQWVKYSELELTPNQSGLINATKGISFGAACTAFYVHVYVDGRCVTSGWGTKVQANARYTWNGSQLSRD